MKKAFILILALILIGSMAFAEDLSVVTDYVTSQGFTYDDNPPSDGEPIDAAFCYCYDSYMQIGEDKIPMCFIIWGQGSQYYMSGGMGESVFTDGTVKSIKEAKQLYIDILGMYNWDVAIYGTNDKPLFAYNYTKFANESSSMPDMEYDNLTEYTASVSEYIACELD